MQNYNRHTGTDMNSLLKPLISIPLTYLIERNPRVLGDVVHNTVNDEGPLGRPEPPEGPVRREVGQADPACPPVVRDVERSLHSQHPQLQHL